MKKYRVLPEYYDQWQASPDNDLVTEDFVQQMTHPSEWDMPIDKLLGQLTEITD